MFYSGFKATLFSDNSITEESHTYNMQNETTRFMRTYVFRSRHNEIFRRKCISYH